MDDALRALVRGRANGRCEYCRFPEAASFLQFAVDHIIAEKHGGPTVEANLAWSCYYCNSYKGPNIAGWIAETDEVVRLFHPRRHTWEDHFEWQGCVLLPRTLIGRVTVEVLEINQPDAIAVREELLGMNGFDLGT
ncbi:MAG: HNH endonuclease [Planctomycetaceae bacterium]|nr:HNH endonuclease [Planctomycetaceae bacterium]